MKLPLVYCYFWVTSVPAKINISLWKTNIAAKLYPTSHSAWLGLSVNPFGSASFLVWISNVDLVPWCNMVFEIFEVSGKDACPAHLHSKRNPMGRNQTYIYVRQWTDLLCGEDASRLIKIYSLSQITLSCIARLGIFLCMKSSILLTTISMITAFTYAVFSKETSAKLLP